MNPSVEATSPLWLRGDKKEGTHICQRLLRRFASRNDETQMLKGMSANMTRFKRLREARPRESDHYQRTPEKKYSEKKIFLPSFYLSRCFRNFVYSIPKNLIYTYTHGTT